MREFLWMLIIVILLICCGKAKAQVLPEYSAFPSSSIGLQFGTQGIGVQGSKSISQSLNARFGFNTVPGITVQYNNRDLKLDRTSVYAIVDWQPLFGRNDFIARKWFVSAGVGYYFTNSLYRGGTNDYTIYMSKLRPYVGTGLGNIRLSNSINMRLDLGYYIPTQAATATISSKAEKINGMRGILSGTNTALTLYYKF
jgi:hypothetical protein